MASLTIPTLMTPSSLSIRPDDSTVAARISGCLADISAWMKEHHLQLNLAKTELLVFPATPTLQHDFTIQLGSSTITSSALVRNLGVIFDDQLTFKEHIAKTAWSCRFALHNIRKIRSFLTEHAAQLLVQALVISRLDYCNALLSGLPSNTIKPLQMIQNAAARLVFNEPMLHLSLFPCTGYQLQLASSSRHWCLHIEQPQAQHPPTSTHYYESTSPPEAPPTSTHYYESTSPPEAPPTSTHFYESTSPPEAPPTSTHYYKSTSPPEAPPTSTHYYESTSPPEAPPTSTHYYKSTSPPEAPPTSTHYYESTSPPEAPPTSTHYYESTSPPEAPPTSTHYYESTSPSRSPAYFHSLLRIYIPSRSPAYFHSLLRIYIPSRSPAYFHSLLRIYIPSRSPAYFHSLLRIYIPSRSPAYFHSRLRIYIPSRSPAYFHSLLRIYIPSRSPAYFHSRLRIYIPSRSLRSASERRLVVPSQRGSKSLSRTFSFTVPDWWNDPPPHPERWIPVNLQATTENSSLSTLLDLKKKKKKKKKKSFSIFIFSPSLASLYLFEQCLRLGVTSTSSCLFVSSS